MTYRTIEGAGRWDGDTFIFTPPVIIDGQLYEQLDCAELDLALGVSREDAIEALLNPMEPAVDQRKFWVPWSYIEANGLPEDLEAAAAEHNWSEA